MKCFYATDPQVRRVELLLHRARRPVHEVLRVHGRRHGVLHEDSRGRREGRQDDAAHSIFSQGRQVPRKDATCPICCTRFFPRRLIKIRERRYSWLVSAKCDRLFEGQLDPSFTDLMQEAQVCLHVCLSHDSDAPFVWLVLWRTSVYPLQKHFFPA